jgi:hypothetical protein
MQFYHITRCSFISVHKIYFRSLYNIYLVTVPVQFCHCTIITFVSINDVRPSQYKMHCSLCKYACVTVQGILLLLYNAYFSWSILVSLYRTYFCRCMDLCHYSRCTSVTVQDVHVLPSLYNIYLCHCKRCPVRPSPNSFITVQNVLRSLNKMYVSLHKMCFCTLYQMYFRPCTRFHLTRCTSVSVNDVTVSSA